LPRRNNRFSANVELFLNRESLTPNLRGVSLKHSLRITLRVRSFYKIFTRKRELSRVAIQEGKVYHR